VRLVRLILILSNFGKNIPLVNSSYMGYVGVHVGGSAANGTQKILKFRPIFNPTIYVMAI
jgi:hypothetical protein